MSSPLHCPVEDTLSVIGGKWKSVIIWHLQEKTKRFGELKKQINVSMASSGMLQQQQ